MYKIMQVFSDITTMHINATKTLAIFLGRDAEQPDTMQCELNYTWTAEGRYLGFVVGPPPRNPHGTHQSKNTRPGSRNGIGKAWEHIFP